jgi:nicotinamidase-related amidase
MAFPSIAAVADGYQVFAVIDASGTYSKMAEEITLARMLQAGVVPIDRGRGLGAAKDLEPRRRGRMGTGLYRHLPQLPAADRKLRRRKWYRTTKCWIPSAFDFPHPPLPLKEIVMSNKPYIRLDKDNAAVLLVDHQTGLLSLVRDIDPDKFKNNVLALADMAEYFKLPTILTTSFENGPNGPLVPELKEKFPTGPYIARPGQINAWDNEDFVKAVKATGKKQLIVAGVVTEVCVAFPVLSALAEGFEVFVIADASGTFNSMTQQAAWSRMEQAGAQLMTWFGAACELHRDWRNDIEGWGLCSPTISPTTAT